MSIPTKVTQILPATGIVSTAAALPATINADGRSTNLLGTEGAFLSAGPQGFGSSILSMPGVASTLAPAHVFNGILTVTGGVGANIQMPTAADLVSFLTQQYAATTSAAYPNTGTVATAPAYYPSFDFVCAMQAAGTLVGGSGVTFTSIGTGGSAPNDGPFGVGQVRHYRGVITNSTVGAQAVNFIRLT